jgi:hypothetical protein
MYAELWRYLLPPTTVGSILYGGMKSTEAKRLKELEQENSRLKRLLAEAELDKAMLKELVAP